jgi:hypothetical protein
MSLIQQIGTLRTLSFALGVMFGLVNAAYAQSGTDDRVPAHPPGPQLVLDQWSTVAGHWRRPTAEEIHRRIDERGTTPSARAFRDEDREVRQVYDEIMR